MKTLTLMFAPALLVIPAEIATAKPLKICVEVQVKTYQEALNPPQRPARHATPRPAPRPPARPTVMAPASNPDEPGSPRGAAAGTSPPAARPRPRPVTSWSSPYGTTRPSRVRSLSSARWRARGRRWSLPVRSSARYPYPPHVYLKRLVEHYVTHDKDHVAVQQGCAERIDLEMYPVKGGWTVFARYSKRASEEKVDLLEFGEFIRFAERAVKALLHGKDIATTANLRTILKADSLRKYRTIKGSHHFTFSLGAAPKIAQLPTYDGHSGLVETQWRPLTPLTFSLGYRGRFNAWGIDAFVRGGVGLQRESAVNNTAGGHVDLDGLFGIGLHFLRYYNPHGMISFYYGAGALFDLTFFSAIEPLAPNSGRDRFTGGGLNLDFVIGFEFMRASTAQFFIQIALSAPVYMVEIAPEAGPNSKRVKTYIPELGATVGMMF
ncbi:MAG: hypothetical protein ABI333_27060 [bacterium]